jgi:hypothetical protein
MRVHTARIREEKIPPATVRISAKEDRSRSVLENELSIPGTMTRDNDINKMGKKETG